VKEHDLIVGPYREEIVKELALNMLSDAQGCATREWLSAASRAIGLVIGGSYSPEMHEGCMAACMDTINTWAKQISK
jgi:hypothetical protein